MRKQKFPNSLAASASFKRAQNKNNYLWRAKHFYYVVLWVYAFAVTFWIFVQVDKKCWIF